MTKAKRHLNTETGEVLSLVALEGQGRKVYRPKADDRRRFTIVYVAAGQILKDDLTIGEWKMLWLFVTTVPREAPLGTPILAEMSVIAQENSWDYRTVRRSMKGLIDKGIVVRDPEHSKTYWLNPEYAWRGDEADRKDAQKRLNGHPV